MGIGYVMVVAAPQAEAVIGLLQAEGQRATVIGEIVSGLPGVELRP
jgi:phosphoribosylaminoimidazole (AIR) synthetase